MHFYYYIENFLKKTLENTLYGKLGIIYENCIFINEYWSVVQKTSASFWTEKNDMNRNTFATECYKGDTYRTNKFIKNNKFVVLDEAISELSHKE